VPPNNFLTCWTKHLKLRQNVLNIANIPPVTDVKPDYKIVGQVRVEQDGKIIMFSTNPEHGQNSLLALKRQINDAKKENEAN
jgi:hypothetical protein